MPPALTWERQRRPRPKLDPEARRGLRSLGYISGSESRAQQRDRPSSRSEGQDAAAAGAVAGAVSRRRRAIRRGRARSSTRSREASPRIPRFIWRCRPLYLRRGNAQAAVGTARRAVALDPESPIGILNLAFAYQNGGRIDDAATGFQRVLALDPGNVKALVGIAEIYRQRGSREQAFAYYQRAAAAAPTFASVHTGLGIVALELNRRDVATDGPESQPWRSATRRRDCTSISACWRNSAGTLRRRSANIGPSSRHTPRPTRRGSISASWSGDAGECQCGAGGVRTRRDCQDPTRLSDHILSRKHWRRPAARPRRSAGPHEALRRGPNEPRVKELVAAHLEETYVGRSFSSASHA